MKVRAYSKTTGRSQMVPAHWLDHPVLGRNLSQTPVEDEPAQVQAELAEEQEPVEPVEQDAGDEPTTDETPASGDQE